MDNAQEYMEQAKYDLNSITDAQYSRMVEVTREPLTILSDITDAVSYFFGDDVEVDEETKAKVLDGEVAKKVLPDFIAKAKEWDFTEENLHEKLEEFRGFYKEQGIKPKETMWAIRAAVTGRTRGADMCATLCILGKDKVIARCKKAL